MQNDGKQKTLFGYPVVEVEMKDIPENPKIVLGDMSAYITWRVRKRHLTREVYPIENQDLGINECITDFRFTKFGETSMLLDGKAQNSAKRTGLWTRLRKWFGEIINH